GAEPWLSTIRAPKSTRTSTIGPSHHFFRTRMKTQSSPRSETIAERATLVAYPWRSTTVKGRGVQRGLAITLVDLEQLTDGGAPGARRNSWGWSSAATGRETRGAAATTGTPCER